MRQGFVKNPLLHKVFLTIFRIRYKIFSFYCLRSFVMKKFLFLFTLCVFITLNAETIDIEIPDVRFTESGGFVVPTVEGFELDGTAEDLVLPFKKMFFASEIEKIEILKHHKIVTKAPLKKGEPLFRMIDMKKVPVVKSKQRKLPSVSKFTFNHRSTFKRKNRQFVFDFYPVIPAGGSEIIKIDKIRVHTKGRALLPQINTQSRNSLLILTTEYFLRESTEINNYIEAKMADGFNVDVATENSYGGGTLTGRERFFKIREYLKSVYQNYDFLLIIANPSPSGDEVPMLVTRPCETDMPSYDNVPTDIFYGELTEDIDSNGNGIYGESEDYITLSFELIVGRIPIYGQSARNADKILARTVKFIKERPANAEIRRRLLFPATISYYENQDGQYMPKMDGAYIVEYLRNRSIKEPFTSKALVEYAGLDPSEFAGVEDPITYDSVLENFNNGYGVVFWMGHGETNRSVRTIWRYDRNGSGYADTYELASEDFVDTNLIGKTGKELHFVFQGSCLNGTIEAAGSLAYAMLQKTSVGVVGASQVSYGAIWKDYDLSSQDIFAYGTVFTDALVNNRIPAQVLFETKENWSDWSVLLTDKYETNYLGDPSLRINVRSCVEDSECDDMIYCNGAEKCVDGFCEKVSGAVPCAASENPCETNKCDEATKSCRAMPKADGSYCSADENMCISGRQCISGKCESMDEKDCSYLDSFCAKGECNPKTGECVKTSVNEGVKCSTGQFCVKNEVCAGGLCKGEEPDYPAAAVCNKMDCSEFDGFVEIADQSQNWDACTTKDGKKGYCSYGLCTATNNSDEESKSSSDGCSVLFL